MSHTPGLWKYDDNEGFGFIVSSHSGTICQIASCDEEADARLIAAAPEMLEALRAILRNGTTMPMTEFDVANIKHVIGKAEGQ
jgi:hypothetical protein